jgi:hypothetical protein
LTKPENVNCTTRFSLPLGERILFSESIRFMPWRKRRVICERKSSSRRQAQVFLDLSILISAILLIVTGWIAIQPMLDYGVSREAIQQGAPLLPFYEGAPAYCAFAAVVCLLYLSVALSIRSRG